MSIKKRILTHALLSLFLLILIPSGWPATHGSRNSHLSRWAEAPLLRHYNTLWGPFAPFLLGIIIIALRRKFFPDFTR